MSWVQGSRKAKTKAQRNITVNSNKNSKGEKKERDVAALGWDIWKSFSEIFFTTRGNKIVGERTGPDVGYMAP